MNNTQDLLTLFKAMSSNVVLVEHIKTEYESNNHNYFFDPSTEELMNWLLTLGYFDIIDTRNDIDINHPTITYCIHDTDIGEGCFYSGVDDVTTEMLNISIQVAKYINDKEKK